MSAPIPKVPAAALIAHLHAGHGAALHQQGRHVVVRVHARAVPLGRGEERQAKAIGFEDPVGDLHGGEQLRLEVRLDLQARAPA
jgi:hypothetical protein